MPKITYTIMGEGKVGRMLHLLLQRHDPFSLLDILHPSQSLNLKAPAQWNFITTPDAAIHDTAKKLAALPVEWAGCSVIHCSGALSASVLQPLAERGATIASCHPMLSVMNSERAALQFAGTLCALEGDEGLCAELSTWLKSLGACPSQVSAAQKSLYHAACSIAANYWVTLSAVAQDCLQQAGVDPAVLKSGILQLQKSVIENLSQQSDFMKALTGPIARGDVATLELHRQALLSLGYEDFYHHLAELTQRKFNSP